MPGDELLPDATYHDGGPGEPQCRSDHKASPRLSTGPACFLGGPGPVEQAQPASHRLAAVAVLGTVAGALLVMVALRDVFDTIFIRKAGES